MNLKDEMLNKFDKEGLGSYIDGSPSIPVGIGVLDYANGAYIERDDGLNLETGFQLGKIHAIIGKSGGGKSSLIGKAAGKIIEGVDDALMIYYDVERTVTDQRLKALTKLSNEEYDEKVIILNDASLCNENFYGIVQSISEKRKEKKAPYPPTVMVIDSLAALRAKKSLDNDELTSDMNVTKQAKINNNMFKDILGMLFEYNITLFIINHITTAISINPMAPTQTQVNYLKQGESLPGGSGHIYYSQSMLKLTPKKKLIEDSEYGIKGFETEAEFVKTKSSIAGRPFKLIFSQKDGFHSFYSDFLFLKEQKLISGGGRSYHISTMPDVKFSQKDAYRKYKEIPAFKEAFDTLLGEALMVLVPVPEDIDSKYSNEK